MPTAPPVVPIVSQLIRIQLCLLVVPVRVPVRGCARVLLLDPLRVLPVLCPLNHTPRQWLLEPVLIYARSWPPARGGPAMSRV